MNKQPLLPLFTPCYPCIIQGVKRKSRGAHVNTNMGLEPGPAGFLYLFAYSGIRTRYFPTEISALTTALQGG